MRTALSAFHLHRPRSLTDALRVMREEPATVPLAGCTDVFVALNAGTPPGTHYLDLTPLGGLARIAEKDGVLSIGALATYTAIIKSRLVRQQLPMLVAAAREVGGAQIQNRGTLGGNVANASPAGDTLPVLAVAEAVVVLRSAADGERRVPFTSFYTGYRASVRHPDELIVALEFPPVEGKQWFRKVGTRAAQAISKVMMAGVRSSRPRLALGSVAATVVRLPRAEAALAGGASIDEAVRILSGEITPIDDIRSTAEYRLAVAGNLLRAYWRDTAVTVLKSD
ncbi:MAG: FAD binding domain-containing protein [Gemmatimonadetes bacterium]|nr:FAD binding domain-containing protein [Gemmatimonadota bacterium]